MGSRRRFFLLAAIVAAAVGCASPTLPLPPPSQPEVSLEPGEPQATVAGDATPGALVMILNDDLGTGVIATAGRDGRYVAKVDVKWTDASNAKLKANTLEIWQRVGNGDSPPILYLLWLPQ